MNNATVRSHYLPRTYLKHFLSRDALFMYKKGEKFFKPDTKPARRIVRIEGEGGLTNIGLENNLYDPEVDASFNANDIEEIFQEYGEKFLDSVISEIEGKATGQPIGQEIKNKLCIFLAAMRVRTPLFKWETEESASLFSKHNKSRLMENISTADLKREINAAGKDYTEEQLEIVRQTLIDKKYD